MPVEYKKMEREAKWSKYLLDENGQGPHLLQCMLAKNKGWTQTCGEVAKRISGIYKLTSERFHETAHDIDAAKEDEFGKKNIVVPLSSQSGTQILNVMQCIGDVLGFSVSIQNTKPN